MTPMPALLKLNLQKFISVFFLFKDIHVYVTKITFRIVLFVQNFKTSGTLLMPICFVNTIYCRYVMNILQKKDHLLNIIFWDRLQYVIKIYKLISKMKVYSKDVFSLQFTRLISVLIFMLIFLFRTKYIAFWTSFISRMSCSFNNFISKFIPNELFRWYYSSVIHHWTKNLFCWMPNCNCGKQDYRSSLITVAHFNNTILPFRLITKKKNYK